MMNNIFYAKYININVKSKSTHDNKFMINEGNEFIEIHKVDELNYEMEIFTYNFLEEYFSQFAIGFYDNLKPNEVYMTDENNNERSSMFEITDFKDNSWWIESGKIEKGFFKSKTLKNFGSFIIHIEILNRTYKIYVKVSKNETLTDEGVEELHQAFQGELYKLITVNEKTYLKNKININEIKQNELSNIELDLIDSYIDNLRKIIRNPYKTLFTESAKFPLRSIKPTLTTFIEYSVNKEARYYTSRIQQETIHNAVNSYLLFITENLLWYLKQYQKNNIFILEQNQNEVKRLSSSLPTSIMSDTDFKNMRTKRLEEEINYLRKFENVALSNDSAPTCHHTIFFKVDYFWEKYQGFCCTDLNTNKKFILIVNNKDFTFSFKYKWLNLIKELVEPTFKFNAEIFMPNNYIPLVTEEIKDSFGYPEKIEFYICNLKSFDQLNYFSNGFKPLRNSSNKQSESRISLENNLKVIKNQIALYESNTEIISKINEVLESRIKSISNLLNNLQKLGIKASKIEPSSVVFFNHPNYSVCYSNFNKIKNSKEVLLINKMQECIKLISTKAIFDIYEYWCLLKILDVLINKLQFYPKNLNWRESLLHSLTPPSKEFILNLENSQKYAITFYAQGDIPNDLELTQFEKELYIENKIKYEEKHKKKLGLKTPDFRIKFHNGIAPKTDLIMDAKFNDPCDLSGLCKLLADNEFSLEKNYRGDWFGYKNWVYILAPAIPLIENPPLSYNTWQHYAYYGATEFFDWGDRLPLHKHGGILLTPRMKNKNQEFLNSDDHLQRLLIMFLQFQGYTNCIVCGSETTKVEKDAQSGRTYYEYYCQNAQCGHMFTHTHCQACSEKIIFKNGINWTYQKVNPNYPEDFQNIACPSCESYYVPT